MAALPPEYRHELSHQARWLFRTLRSAELAGLDPAEVARSAIASRDLAGARDIASVVDARIRQRIYPLLPQPQGPWANRVPELPDAGHEAYLAEIATMMDDRKQRLGQHAAQHANWSRWTSRGIPAPPCFCCLACSSSRRHSWQIRTIAGSRYRAMRAFDALGLIFPFYLLLFAATYYLMERASAGELHPAADPHGRPVLQRHRLHDRRIRRHHREIRDRPGRAHRPDARRPRAPGCRRTGTPGSSTPRPATKIRHRRRRRPSRQVTRSPTRRLTSITKRSQRLAGEGGSSTASARYGLRRARPPSHCEC